MKRKLRLLLLHLLALLLRPLARRPTLGTPARILVLKPDHLGDLLLATPALRALRQSCPQAQISALIGPWSLAALAGNPDIDRVLTLPFPGFERQKVTTETQRRRAFEDGGWKIEAGRGSVARSHHAPPSSILHPLSSIFSASLRLCGDIVRPYLALLRYGLLLRRAGYDTALLLRDDHWWGAALALAAGIPRRIGYAVPECRPFLTTALPWNPREHVTAQGLRLVERVGEFRVASFELVPSTGSDTAQPATRFIPSPADAAWADAWLRAHGIDEHTRLVVIHPGTGGAAKLWPPKRWSALADALLSAVSKVPGAASAEPSPQPSAPSPQHALLITGGPGEQALVERVAAGMARRPLTLAGATSVGQLAALLSRAALVLGVDSGPLHLAVAVGVPTLHLYGPGDPGRFGPWGDPARHVVLRAGLWCSPCGIFSACPRGTDPPECMAAIGVDQALAAALASLEKGEQEGSSPS
jgi:heptosyltransferase-2/heptosyltransferase-3